MENETLYAYAAGIFDGEGYVDIYKASISKASKSPSFMLRVIISQKDGLIMKWLEDNFGGHVLYSSRNGTYIYRWDIRSKRALNFLKLIYPFVQIKKKQLDVAIEFEERRGTYLETLKGFQGFRRLSDEEIGWREKMSQKLKSLKKEYVSYTKSSSRTTTKRKNV